MTIFNSKIMKTEQIQENMGGVNDWEIEEIQRQNQMLFQQLIKVGNFGYETEKMREKVLFAQTNGIFTIISIYSLVVLYIFSLNIIELRGFRLVLFFVLVYANLVVSLLFVIKAQIQGGYLDMGTIDEMDGEYTEAMMKGTPLDVVYVRDLHNVHLNRRNINDRRDKFISKSYIFLYASLIMPIILVVAYYLWDLPIAEKWFIFIGEFI
jgi:hypothetical protein